MKRDRRVASAPVELFPTSGVDRDYARRFLNNEQIDYADVGRHIAEEVS